MNRSKFVAAVFFLAVHPFMNRIKFVAAKSIKGARRPRLQRTSDMTAPAAAPSQFLMLDKHLTTIVNCLQNVVNVMMLLHFLEVGMFWICLAATIVSPVESWKGLFYNMWISLLVGSMMMAFKDTLEALILFENFKRARDGRKDATTIIAAGVDGVQIKHVNNGSTSTVWGTVAGLALQQFLNKVEKNEDETTKAASTENEAPAQNEDDAKAASTPVSTGDDEIKQDAASTGDDEIKQDAASASSSARSSADTADVLN